MLVSRRSVAAIIAGSSGVLSGCLTTSSSPDSGGTAETVVALESQGETRSFSFEAETGASVDIELSYRGDGQGWFTLESPDDQQLFSLAVVGEKQESFTAERSGTFSGTIIPNNKGTGDMDVTIEVRR